MAGVTLDTGALIAIERGDPRLQALLDEAHAAAAELYAAGVLPINYADTLKLLNEARKAVFYEGEDPDLEDQSLEDIASTVKSAVDQAEQAAGE